MTTQGESALLTITCRKNKNIKIDKSQANQNQKYKIPPQDDNIKKDAKHFIL